MTGWEWAPLVAVGAIGAASRYLVDLLVQQRRSSTFPFGTTVVNVSGSLVLGLITGLVLFHGFPQAGKVIIGTGFCGAYTTFSTLSLESVELARGGSLRLGILNVFGSTIVGCLFAALGLVIAAV